MTMAVRVKLHLLVGVIFGLGVFGAGCHNYGRQIYYGGQTRYCSLIREMPRRSPHDTLERVKAYCRSGGAIGCSVLLALALANADEEDLTEYYLRRAADEAILFPYHCFRDPRSETYQEELGPLRDFGPKAQNVGSWPPPRDWQEADTTAEEHPRDESQTMGSDPSRKKRSTR
jgi:hypothetical protein